MTDVQAAVLSYTYLSRGVFLFHQTDTNMGIYACVSAFERVSVCVCVCVFTSCYVYSSAYFILRYDNRA